MSRTKIIVALALVATVLVASASAAARAAEMRPTPFGHYPKDCIHVVHEGSSIVPYPGGGLLIKHTSGNKMVPHNPRCAEAKKAQAEARAQAQAQAKPGKIYPPFGWTAYVRHFTGSGNVYPTSFSANYPVPTNPASWASQVLFLFTSLAMGPNATMPENQSILQPVVQWGKSENGGGSFYGISVWYTDGNGTLAVTDLKQYLQNNEQITSLMQMSTTTNNQWVASMQSAKSKLKTSLTVQLEGAMPNVYAAFANYDSDGDCATMPYGNPYTLTFTNMAIKQRLAPITPQWLPSTQEVCSEKVTVNSPDSVTLQWVGPW